MIFTEHSYSALIAFLFFLFIFGYVVRTWIALFTSIGTKLPDVVLGVLSLAWLITVVVRLVSHVA